MTGRRHTLISLFSVVSLGLSSAASAMPLVFEDDFDAGAKSDWGNQSGNWRDTGGEYDATNPDNSPITYSSVTTLELEDFAVDVDVNGINDGGLWLRSVYNGGSISGVLLVTGGFGGGNEGFYWHTVEDGAFSTVLGLATPGGIQGTNRQLRVEVSGDTYALFLDGALSPVTTLTTSLFASGQFGLYDFSPTSGLSSPRGQTFDNVQIFADLDQDVPAPGALALIGIGLLGLGFTRRQKRCP